VVFRYSLNCTPMIASCMDVVYILISSLYCCIYAGDCGTASYPQIVTSWVKPEPIMLLKLPIMLLSNAPKISLLCSNYAQICPSMP